MLPRNKQYTTTNHETNAMVESPNCCAFYSARQEFRNDRPCDQVFYCKYIDHLSKYNCAPVALVFKLFILKLWVVGKERCVDIIFFANYTTAAGRSDARRQRSNFPTGEAQTEACLPVVPA